jgi:hypothetical protein
MVKKKKASGLVAAKKAEGLKNPSESIKKAAGSVGKKIVSKLASVPARTRKRKMKHEGDTFIM